MSSIETRSRHPAQPLRRANPMPQPRLSPGVEAAPPSQIPAASPQQAPQQPATDLPIAIGPIIPPHSIAGKALIAVVAIMSFLAALTLGAVVLVQRAAGEWQAQVARELTIQVRPSAGRDIEADVAQAVEIARSTRGVEQARAHSQTESARLLEPWLGLGLSLDDLPVPRLIVIRLARGAAPDLSSLRQSLAMHLVGATLDDHRAFVDRMRTRTRLAVMAGTAVLALVLAATILLIAFATRGAMATNRAVVEVLHFVGAKNGYIAGQFQRHFLLLGLKGAALGAGAAAAVFLLAWAASGPYGPGGADAETEALFGAMALGREGYLGMLGVLVLVAAVTALTSRFTVHRTLGALE